MESRGGFPTQENFSLGTSAESVCEAEMENGYETIWIMCFKSGKRHQHYLVP